MAESLINFLLPKLTTLITDEYKLLQGLESEIKYIRDELASIRAFLRIAEAKKDAGLLNGEQIAWFKQVMEVSYEIEDIVDHFLLRFSHRRGNGFHGCVRNMYTSVKNLPARDEITSKIKDIKNRVVAISERHQRYKSIEGTSELSSMRISDHPIRGHGLLFKEADLVGIDGPKMDIISLIHNNDESNKKAISVVGMGGSGKTTLVKRVFEEVKSAYSINAWLTISQTTFIIEDALKNLMRQISMNAPAGMDSMNTSELGEHIQRFLQGKRYVIVLDDLWKSVDWESIGLIFPDNICGCCILITTRLKDIAKMCCPKINDTIYEMKPLSDDVSRILFCKKTFQGDNCPPHLEDISRKILKKCGGLPLGIAVIGGVLALKNNNKNEWEMILHSLHAGELESNGKLDPITKIILLSYNDLPSHLKPCLLYMGIYPEDTFVNAEELSYFWIAEGYIEVRQGVNPLEVAQEYLNELSNRSLIQVTDIEIDMNPISCRVHDLIHNIILSKCKEYNTVLSIASGSNTEFPKNVRRLVVDQPPLPLDNVQLPHLRSLIIRRDYWSSPLDSYESQLLKGSSNLLKVLHFKYSNINSIPKEVFKFHNLTYLNLEHTNVTNISKSIRKLQNLEYLNLTSTNVKELPADIIMLKKLFYLFVSRFPGRFKSHEGYEGFKAPQGFGRMTSLHHLGVIEVDSVKVIREIGKLTQLRTLKIMMISSANESELYSSLQKLTNLQVLSIDAIENQPHESLTLEYSFSSTHFQHLRDLNLEGRLLKILPWVSSCHGLIRLSLTNTFLNEDPLGSLEGLPNLVELNLYDNAYMGDSLNFKDGGFRKLQELYLMELSGLKSVTLEKGTMPCLDYMSIHSCKLLEELPDDIRYLEKLQNLRLLNIDMPDTVLKNLRRLDDINDHKNAKPIIQFYNSIVTHEPSGISGSDTTYYTLEPF